MNAAPRTAPLPALDPAQALRLDHQLCFALYSSSLAMTKLYGPLLAELGLTYPQYLAMLALWERDGPGVGELGERLHLDSGTLTPLLKRLEALGLIERRRSDSDERRVHIHLTTSGRRLRQRALKVPACVLAATQCAPAELVGLVTELKQLRERLRAATAA